MLRIKKGIWLFFLLSLYAILFLGLEISVMVNGDIYDFTWMTFTIVWCSIWCFITEYIGNKKGIKNGGLWGFFLSIIGVIIVGFLPNENDKKIEIVNSVTENSDAIKKYKELLDMGAITEEEFEIKKKELLK